tara:strand:- start:7018 stop:8142 length:1125 start_codon:yes stop_codon:yes gene_type:complete
MMSRFPFTHTEMINSKLPDKKLNICPNPFGTKPVPYKNYNGRHNYGQLDKVNDKLYLIWYVWEFLGHMWYLSEDIDSFIKIIAENENPDNPGSDTFTKYFDAMGSDCNTVYNRHILTYFNVMWMKCQRNPPEQHEVMWNIELAKLRDAFNTYIQKRMTDYEAKSEGEVHPVFGGWKETLLPIYGEHWEDYLWQCTNFDELGQFIINHNEYYRKNEDAKVLLCRLNIPEGKFNFCGGRDEPVAKIDGNEIKIWTRAIDCNEKTLVYPATPIEWGTGGGGILPQYHRHRSIFPNGADHWLEQCKEKEIKVKFIMIQGDIYTDSYENDKKTTGYPTIILCDNKNSVLMTIGNSARCITKSVCTSSGMGGGESKSGKY